MRARRSESRGRCCAIVARRGNNQRLRGLLRELAQQRLRFGYRRLAVILQRLAERVNVKRVYRLYHEEQLHMRRKRHRKRIAGPRGALLPCSRPNQRWCYQAGRLMPDGISYLVPIKQAPSITAPG